MVNIFFEKLYKDDENNLFIKLKQMLINNDKKMIITANPEIFMKARNDDDMVKAIMSSDTLVTPDGEGIVHGAKTLGYSIWGKIAGVDIVSYLFKVGDQLSKTIYIYGSKQEVLDALMQNLGELYPNLHVVGLKNGYENDGDDVFLDMINKSPDIVLVALGVPRQEKLIWKYLDKFDKGIFVGCGGSLDVLSGTKKRAPDIFVRMRLEWLYRLMKEPKRIKRFYDSNVKYLFELKRMKKNNHQA